ncbi:BON domain-containing protein [Alteromonas lipolytica]|uniref:Transporter n=1 Tax=Alteromonas lipolytica TaxID=1856405 RepID=A0A1E8FFZ6_9ALTE|nr:BON domain-containing protein [Alteromonas lipolytica]OFI34851.1 transporter [Alteromonas lipolytica]GGF54504.1 transporter [Alteromonas lipolytica]
MKRSVLSLIVAGVIATGTAGPAFASAKWEDKAKDAWIDGKAEATLLFNTHLNSFDINTDVHDGVIVLTGKVDSSIDKKLAEELVIGIDGVVSVDNRLSIVESVDEPLISEQTSNDLTDAKIATVVKSRLLMDSDISGLDIDVDVADKKVTLSGSVDSEAERALAVEIAKNASQVEAVDDLLEVNESE